MTRLQISADRHALARAAAEVLGEALAGQGARTFIATGGTTPAPAYDRLAQIDLSWSGITVVPSDERFVDPASEESNERLLRTHLLVGRAAQARFVPLKAAGPTPHDDARAAEAAVRDCLPASVTLLGMGADGHIGSLFPAMAGLADCLDPKGDRWVVGVDHSPDKPPVPRISLTLRALLSSRLIVVLVSGAEKRALIERVLAEPGYAPPVAAILRQHAVPVRTLWAP